MPFVQRVVGPVHLSRVKLHDDSGAPTVRDRELDAVTNFALSNALRQMASVAGLADEVFRELRDQLTDVATRSADLKRRVLTLGNAVDLADPKAVTVRKFLDLALIRAFFFFFVFISVRRQQDRCISLVISEGGILDEPSKPVCEINKKIQVSLATVVIVLYVEKSRSSNSEKYFWDNMSKNKVIKHIRGGGGG